VFINLTVFAHVSGPFVSALANRYGFRTVCMLGSVLGGIGFAFSYFANSVTYLFFSYGILGGKHTTPNVSAMRSFNR
jgi:MFS family permease